MFIAVLALHDLKDSSQPRNGHGVESASQRGRYSTSAPWGKDTYIPPAAYRFMTQYLSAVIEHHNTPTVFSDREAFIIAWKNSAWDVYTAFGPAQKKLLKNLMKKLTKEWEVKLNIAEHELGRKMYEKKVAQFVECLVPRRKDQDAPAASLGDGAVSEEGSSDVNMADNSLSYCVGDIEGNELLDALRTPFIPKSKNEKAESGHGKTESGSEEEVRVVTDLRTAIEAVQRVRPRDMLPMLMRLFPDL